MSFCRILIVGVQNEMSSDFRTQTSRIRQYAVRCRAHSARLRALMPQKIFLSLMARRKTDQRRIEAWPTNDCFSTLLYWLGSKISLWLIYRFRASDALLKHVEMGLFVHFRRYQGSSPMNFPVRTSRCQPSECNCTKSDTKRKHVCTVPATVPSSGNMYVQYLRHLTPLPPLLVEP